MQNKISLQFNYKITSLPGASNDSILERRSLFYLQVTLCMEEVPENGTEFDDSLEHLESEECQCAECQCAKKRYVQIIDVDRYINSLNDWD